MRMGMLLTILIMQKKRYMDYMAIIDKYYAEGSELRRILLTHSRSVADKALDIARNHPELDLDLQFVEEAAMLHDIGVFLCNAPGIECFGDAPYICHGTLGAELLNEAGFPRHALVCERHTGAGLSLRQIEEQNLPVPHRELMPVSMEEQLICFADKFFSKTRLTTEKTVEQAYNSVAKFGVESAERFKKWCEIFL
jgi:uncharacterized protein